MKIEMFTSGALETNSYVVYDTPSPFLVDAPEGNEDSIDFALRNKVDIKAVLLTHAHFDHTAGLVNIRKAFPGIKIYLSPDDRYLVEDGYRVTREQLSSLSPELLSSFPFSSLPEENEYIPYGDEIFSFKVLKTPGHTKGSVSFYSQEERTLFSGDTMFNYGYGRTDLGGNEEDMRASLATLLSLPPNTSVYPGHGPATTIARERTFYSFF